MDATAFLEKVKRLDVLLKNKLIEREQWRDLALIVTAHSDGDRVQSSGNLQKMSDAIARCVDMEAEINAIVERLAIEKADVLSVIEQLPPDEYDVLHMKYIQHLTNDEINMARDRSGSWASTIASNGRKNVQMILDRRGA